MTVEIKGTKKEGTIQGLDPNLLGLMGITMNYSGLSGPKKLTSGKRYGEEHHDMSGLFPDHWNKIKAFGQTKTLASLAEAVNDPAVTKLMKQLILRVKDVERGTGGKTGDWGKWGRRNPGGSPGQVIPVEDPEIIYGSGDTGNKNWKFGGIKKVNKLIDDNPNLSRTRKTALKSQIEKNIGRIRKVYGGHGSKHHQGVKGDFRYRELNPKTLATWKALGLRLTHEPRKRIVDVDFSKIKDMTPAQLQEKLNSRAFKNKVSAIMQRNKTTGISTSEHGELTKAERFHNSWYNQLGTATRREAPRQQQTDTTVSIDEKYKIPKKKSDIAAWMKKHGWKGKDLGKLVNGKWKGYHPGDIIEEKVEEKTTIETPEAPISQDDTIPSEDASAINDYIDKASSNIQTRSTHPQAVDTSPPLGTLDQPELEQLDEQATEEDYLPGKLPAPEVPPNEFQDFSQKEVSSLDQPTPYGVYAKGQPEFAAAEEEQVLAAKDGVFVDKEKIEEEAEMGPIFPGQDPIVRQPVPYQDAPKAATGEAPITPEQFQAQPDQPVQPQPDQPTQPQQVESVDEVVMEYVQEGKTPQGRNKLNQMVKEGKTTRKEVFETIKKYDKSSPQEPEDIMSAHARDMGKKPGPMMQKGLGLTEEEVVEVEKKKKVPVAPPPPKPDVVQKSGLEQVADSLKGLPSDIDKKKIYDPEAYEKDMWEMDQMFQAKIKRALKDEAEADVELQKVEPYRFWHSMSTPAKIVSALGALVAGYALPAEGAAAAYNMINSAIDADVQSQKLDVEQAMRVRKEATRRATNAIERRAKIVGNPETRFKMMQVAKNMKSNQLAKSMGDAKTKLKADIMRNPEEAEKLFKHNPHMLRKVFTPDEIKYMLKVNTDFKKALKDNNVSNVLNAANAMENVFMDMDWKKVNGKMKLMKYDIAEPSGAGDMAMVFSFMKMLDPGSVVREGEFKTAAGMNPQYLFLARKWNKMAKGTMFTTSDRLSFVDAVNKVKKAKVQDANRVYNMFGDDLTRMGYPKIFILGKPVSMSATPSMRVNKLIKDIMDRKGVDRVEAIKLFKAGRKIVEAQKRGVKFDKTGKPVRPKGEGKPLIGNKQFPIQSRIW